MKIVIDNKIPFIKNVFEPYSEVVYSPGSEINSSIVHDADALIVRTRTKCDRRLLQGSSVRIIASATIGFDHIDTAWCESAGIKWVNAPGCNSGSVMQYIVSSLFYLASNHSLDLRDMTLGVVGVGNVGTKVVSAARALGMRVLQSDPPRKRREGLKEFIGLEKLLKDSDIVTLHVPLTREGHDKTHYLINKVTLSLMKRGAILINSSRGEVTDNTALRVALADEIIAGAILDVWEGEPEADRNLIRMTQIATPHIAGYSVDGKANATIAVVRKVSDVLGIPLHEWAPGSLPGPDNPVINLRQGSEKLSPVELAGIAVNHTYPIKDDDMLFRKDPDRFEYLRDNYRIRREFGSYRVSTADEETRIILSQLGFGLDT